MEGEGRSCRPSGGPWGPRPWGAAGPGQTSTVPVTSAQIISRCSLTTLHMAPAPGTGCSPTLDACQGFQTKYHVTKCQNQMPQLIDDLPASSL